MRLRIAIPESEVSAPIIDAGLETTTRINEQLIRSGAVPTFDEALQAGAVRWHPEPPGDEHFDHAGLVLARGHGDCDDLGPWKAASLRVTGEDPGARSIVYQSGPSRWHAIVQRSSGALQDPSRDAGMGSSSVSGVGADDFATSPSVTAPMFCPDGATSVAVQPHGRLWLARADLPWAAMPSFAFSSTAVAPDVASALHQAVIGACFVGYRAGLARPRDLGKLFVADAIAQGVHPRRVLDGMRAIGMDLDAPAWNRAALIGAAIGCRSSRCAASL